MRNLFQRDAKSDARLDLAGATHEGHHRDHNEDAFGLNTEFGLAVVADGMGGLMRGEVASETVVQCVLEGIANAASPIEALRTAHDRIIKESEAGPQRMGSTAVVVTVEARKASIFWVGDSRAYLYRDGQLRQVTHDHSFVQELIDAGAITAAEGEVHPNRNVVTRAVGIRDIKVLDVDSTDIELRQGDRLLLCSDGLHGYLPEATMLRILSQSGESQAIVDALVAATLTESDAGDNVTVVCASLQS